MSPRRMAAALLGAGAAVLFLTALYLYVPVSTLSPSWRTTRGMVVRSDLSKSHDSVGRLVFQLRSVLQIDVDGTPRLATALSDLPTHDLPVMVSKLQEFAPRSEHTVLYRKDNPEVARFGPEFRWLNIRKPLTALGAGLALALAAILVLRRRPPRQCEGCGDNVKRYFKFCPRCSAPLARSRATIAATDSA